MSTAHALATRGAGVLLHPTSLPEVAVGAGIATAGPRFIEFLAAAGLHHWQMLPVTPNDSLGSPYQSESAFAGNARLIGARDEPEDPGEYAEFQRRHAYWLGDYATFRVAKGVHDGAPWWDWPIALRARETSALADLRSRHAGAIEQVCREQFAFFSQWRRLRASAREHDVDLIGDLPIYVALDSADVWAHRALFRLDPTGLPTAIAGVPPDYFAEHGQRWGNPLYDWTVMAATGFRWWRERVRVQLELFDRLRLDHFRGFQAYWAIPAHAPTAASGDWEPGPGRSLFDALRADLGSLPFIAEDLGIITPAVTALRRDLGLPGMAVLQFAFEGGASNPYLPHHHHPDCLVCTGTHDNDTTLGWYAALEPTTRAHMLAYLGEPGEPMPWPLIRAAFASVAQLAIVPMQDYLALDTRHRMNTPGTTIGNWRWVMPDGALTTVLAARIHQLAGLYDRL